MEKYSKAIGAALGGVTAGTGVIPFLPEGTPWYGYLILYALTIGLPTVLTYAFPKNSGA